MVRRILYGWTDTRTDSRLQMLHNPKLKRYYVRDSILPLDEDETHEFKGHRNICKEDIPPWAMQNNSRKPSRQPISKALNGFLNTGNGGTVYMGIVDNGKVLGLNLSQYQKDHVVASVDDQMSRYRPPVEEHRYKVRFVPVIPPNLPDDEIAKRANYESSRHTDPESRRRQHILRMCNFCWCDKDAAAQLSVGIVTVAYVIEIKIKAWDPDDARNLNPVGDMKAHPVHETEEGKAYFRRQASVTPYNMQEVCMVAQEVCREHYQPQVESKKRQLLDLRSRLAEAKMPH